MIAFLQFIAPFLMAWCGWHTMSYGFRMAKHFIEKKGMGALIVFGMLNCLVGALLLVAAFVVHI